MGEQGPTLPQLSGAEKEGLAGQPSSCSCPVHLLVEWMPFLCSEASLLFLRSPGMADGCGEMTPRMFQWKNTWYTGLDKESEKLTLPLRFWARVARRMGWRWHSKKFGAGLRARGWSGKGVQGSGSDSKDKHGVLLLYSPLGCPWLPGQQKQ